MYKRLCRSRVVGCGVVCHTADWPETLPKRSHRSLRFCGRWDFVESAELGLH